MHHQQIARVVIELYLAVQGRAHARKKTIDEIASVKPFGEQPLLGCVFEDGLEESDVPAAKTPQARGLDVGHYGRHLTRRKLRDGLDVGAVFVTERRVGEQI